MTDLQSVFDDLANCSWAYAVGNVLVETGLLKHMAEPREAAELERLCGLAPSLGSALLDVGVALGVVDKQDGRFVAADGVVPFLNSPAADAVRFGARSNLLQSYDFVQRARAGTLRPGWHYTEADILNAQGFSSGALFQKLGGELLPSLDGLLDRLNGPGAAVLDVGAGVGGICIAAARMWPTARVVGLEPAPAPLAEAHRNVAESGLADRIELRPIRLDELADIDAFDAAWLPQVFLPLDVLLASLRPFYRAIKPGGWALLFAMSQQGADLQSALARLRNVLWGGETRSPAEVSQLLGRAGFVDVRLLPAHNNFIIAGRKSSDG